MDGIALCQLLGAEDLEFLEEFKLLETYALTPKALARELRTEVRAHLAVCGTCRKRVEDARSWQDFITGANFRDMVLKRRQLQQA